MNQLETQIQRNNFKKSAAWLIAVLSQVMSAPRSEFKVDEESQEIICTWCVARHVVDGEYELFFAANVSHAISAELGGLLKGDSSVQFMPETVWIDGASYLQGSDAYIKEMNWKQKCPRSLVYVHHSKSRYGL